MALIILQFINDVEVILLATYLSKFFKLEKDDNFEVRTDLHKLSKRNIQERHLQLCVISEILQNSVIPKTIRHFRAKIHNIFY